MLDDRETHEVEWNGTSKHAAAATVVKWALQLCATHPFNQHSDNMVDNFNNTPSPCVVIS